MFNSNSIYVKIHEKELVTLPINKNDFPLVENLLDFK